MPITAAKGQINLVLENLSNQGMTPLLNNAAIASSMSLTSQPLTSPGTGQRLVLWIQNAMATGTITIAGTDINGNSISEGPITIPQMNAAVQSSFVGKWEYETVKVFKTVNANGITTTGATNSTITIQGISAAKFEIPGILKTKKKFDKFSPNEHRNLLDKDTRRMQTLCKVTVDELSQPCVYPENSIWIAYMLTGSVPTVTTLPASPTSLLSATAVAATMSLTTQPSYPGMAFILTVASSTAVGTIGITGTNQFGQSGITETINANAGGSNGNGTYYSANVYSSIAASAITTTGLTSGTLAISGVYGWKYVFTPGDIVYSATVEQFTGVDSFTLPWTMLDEGTFEFGMDKAFTFTGKGIAQDRVIIGDRTASYLNTNRVSAVSNPTDLPMVGWASQVYIDPSVATIGTNTYGDLLEMKITLKSPQKPGYTAGVSQNYNRVNRGKRETMLDGKIDLTNVLQVEQYRYNLLQYLTFQLLGSPIGGGYSKTWQFTFPCRADDFDIISTPDKENVEADIKATSEYDSGLGGAYLLTIINQQPPTYTV